MPPRAHDQEVRILASIARAVLEPEARAQLRAARSLPELLAFVAQHRPRADSVQPNRPSLADI